MDFNHYYTNEELESTLKEWTQEHSHLAELESIGTSFEGRPLWLLILTNQETGPHTEKPAIWIDANIHATEIAGTTTAMRIAHNLLIGYGLNDQATRLLDHSTFYIMPRVNPDGAALAMSDSPRFLRSGVRPYPFEDRSEGLHIQDIDGDGRILQMRIPDPNGDWKVSTLEPRLMEKRGPAEYGGQYYRLFREGILEDFDGYLIKMARPYQGLDFNRNFPFEWRSEGVQIGAGPYPASEPEIKAIVEFVSKYPNINLGLTYHTFSRVILRPFSTRPDEEMDANDLWVYQKMGDMGTKLTGYRNFNVYKDFRYHPKEVISGAFDDWLFDHRGIFAFTVEQWDMPTEAGIKDRKFSEWFRDHPHEQDVQILHWADEHAGEGAYVDWYPYDHPQLGKVELGGWNTLYTWTNPPRELMGVESERNVPFALAMADLLPHLSIHTLEITPLDKGENEEVDFHILMVLDNSGFLPTYTSGQAKKNEAVRPIRVELNLPKEIELVSGKKRVELGHLEGRSNKLSMGVLWASSPTDNRTRVEWVVKSPPGSRFEVTISSDRAGIIHQEIVLDTGLPDLEDKQQ